MKTFTIDEIRNYLLGQDSLVDALYSLSEENILDANITEPEFEDDITFTDLLEIDEVMSECCTAPIERGLCTDCKEHV